MATGSIQIRELKAQDIPVCETILYSLPNWFGIEESNRAYVDSLRVLPGAVATEAEQIVGFIALIEHTPESYEINVMAVREALHRHGIGTALIRWAESWCRERNIPWLHVKTRGPSTPDPGYDRTRHFYLAQGYAPLFESLTLWGPENAALVLVKHIDCGRSAA
jgi:GNAT superfamily N-acetyltransferase